MRLRNAFACPHQYKTWTAMELQHGSVITSNIPFGWKRWLTSVKALVQIVGIGHANENHSAWPGNELVAGSAGQKPAGRPV
jgi:hypothetical protein